MPVVAIDFKSVGERAASQKFKPVPNTTPIGFKTPLRYGTQSDGIFGMNFDLADQIQDNFRNLLQTNHGERLGLYDFGANLRELSMEHGQDTFDAEAITRITATVNKYMPFIVPRTLESTLLPSLSGMVERVDLTIVYDVPKLGLFGREIVTTIFVRG